METSRDAEAVPIIRRARGFRLYDRQGKRYLDLHRDGGGAFLGHRSGVTVTLMKSVLSQGLVTTVPSVWEARLVRMIASMFSGGCSVRLYSSRLRALEAVSGFLGMRVDTWDVYDPALAAEPLVRPRVVLWRPFLPRSEEGDGASAVVLPILPLSVCEAPAPVCFPDPAAADLPPSDPLPGFLLAGAFSALVRLRSGRLGDFFAVSPLIEKAVDVSPGWKRRGPYVRPIFRSDAYPHVFAEFLRAGVLLSPQYPGPSILPGECSPGEARLLAELFTEIPGG
jgi:hypothetical protein